MNQVDLTYRSELRELNDLNFARFDAKVGERLAELRSELRVEFRSELRSELDARFTKVDERFGKIDQRLETLADRIRDTKTGLVRWMLAFWVATALAVAGSRLAL